MSKFINMSNVVKEGSSGRRSPNHANKSYREFKKIGRKTGRLIRKRNSFRLFGDEIHTAIESIGGGYPGVNKWNVNPVLQMGKQRPSFTAKSKRSAYGFFNLREAGHEAVNINKPELVAKNAAMPHRMSWSDISDSIDLFHNGHEKPEDFKRWTDRLISGGKQRLEAIETMKQGTKEKPKIDQIDALLADAKDSHKAFIDARNAYAGDKSESNKSKFRQQANSFHANVPDIGPHMKVNNPVQEAVHLHILALTPPMKARSASPMTRRVLSMTPERFKKGIAVSGHGEIVTTTGEAIPIDALDPEVKKKIAKHKRHVIKSFDKKADLGGWSKFVAGIRKRQEADKKKTKH